MWPLLKPSHLCFTEHRSGLCQHSVSWFDFHCVKRTLLLFLKPFIQPVWCWHLPFFLTVRDVASVEGCSVFVILSLGSFQVHIPVNECKSCGSYVVILTVINTAEVCMCACLCVCERERERVERWSDREECVHVCIDEGLLSYHWMWTKTCYTTPNSPSAVGTFHKQTLFFRTQTKHPPQFREHLTEPLAIEENESNNSVLFSFLVYFITWYNMIPW